MSSKNYEPNGYRHVLGLLTSHTNCVFHILREVGGREKGIQITHVYLRTYTGSRCVEQKHGNACCQSDFIIERAQGHLEEQGAVLNEGLFHTAQWQPGPLSQE